MEGSIIIAKSGSKTINLDAVQCGFAKEKNIGKLLAFAKAVQKRKQRGQEVIEAKTIKIENIEGNIVVKKENEYVRKSVKEKKAKTIEGTEFKPDRVKRARLEYEFEKHRFKSKNTKNR